MVCEPTPSVAVVKVATPAAFSVPVPSGVVPSRKVMVPAGVVGVGPATPTVAVKVTAWPRVDGFADETTVVVVPKDHFVAAADEVAPVDLADEVVLHPLDDTLDWAQPPGRPALERPATTAER